MIYHFMFVIRRFLLRLRLNVGDRQESHCSPLGINACHSYLGSDLDFLPHGYATNLVPNDTNGYWDIFIRDRCPDGDCEVNYLISGRVVDSAGTGIPDISISAARAYSTVKKIGKTNSNGSFTITDLRPGRYIISPTTSNYSFSPPNQTVILSSDTDGINLIATETPTTKYPIILLPGIMGSRLSNLPYSDASDPNRDCTN